MLFFFRFDTKSKKNVFPKNSSVLLSVNVIVTNEQSDINSNHDFCPEIQTGKIINDVTDVITIDQSVKIITDDQNNISNQPRFYSEMQTGKNFDEMVDTIIANKNIESLNLLNTAYLQRHRIELELILKGIKFSENDEENARLTKQQAEAIALRNRDLWNQENMNAITKLENHFKDKFKLLDWYELCKLYIKQTTKVSSKDSFQYRMSKAIARYESNLKGDRGFKRAIDSLAGIFFEKIPANLRENISKALDNEAMTLQAYLYLRKIVFEEAVMRTMLNYDFEIYRGLGNVPANMIYNVFGEPKKMIPISIGNKEEITRCQESIIVKKNNPKKDNIQITNIKEDYIEITITTIRVPSDKIALILRQFGFFDTVKKNESESVEITKVSKSEDYIEITITTTTIRAPFDKIALILRQFGFFDTVKKNESESVAITKVSKSENIKKFDINLSK